MKKKIIMRGLLGIPLGMAIGDVITITSSLIWGQGEYVPFATASVIWQIDHWSIAKQTGVYFAVTASVMMPVAYIAGWMERSISGAVIYFLIFVLFFGAAWLTQYTVMRYKIRKMNRTLSGR